MCRLLGPDHPSTRPPVRDAHRRPVLQLRAGLSHQHVAIRPPRSQQEQPSRTRRSPRPVYGYVWRGGSRHRACCSSSRAKASLSVSVRPCFAICSGGQGQPTRPVALLCVRRPPAMRVASAAVHAFNSIHSNRGGVQNQPVRPVWIAISLCSLHCDCRRCLLDAVPSRPARPDPTATPTPASWLHERCSATVQSISTALTSPMLTSC